MQEIKYVILIGSILLKLVVPVQNKGMFDYDKDKLRHFSTTRILHTFFQHYTLTDFQVFFEA